MENNRYPFVNLALPYAYDALEPFIDETTMRLHHTRHLQTYIQNLNALLINRPQLQKLTLQQLIIMRSVLLFLRFLFQDAQFSFLSRKPVPHTKVICPEL